MEVYNLGRTYPLRQKYLENYFVVGMVSTKRSGLKCLWRCNQDNKTIRNWWLTPKKLGVVHYSTGCPPRNLFVVIVLGGLYCLYRFMFFLGEIILGKKYPGFAWFSSNIFPRSVNCKPCCAIQNTTLNKSYWGLPANQNNNNNNNNTSQGGCILHLGWNIPVNAGFFRTTGVYTTTTPPPLTKRPDPDCIAVNANFLDADSVPLPQEDSLVDNRD